MPQFIIFLKGVNPQEYMAIEDEFDAKILENIQQTIPTIESTNTYMYNKIHDVFTTCETWPKKTNLKCWHCDFTFESTPVFIPSYISNSQWGVLGNFCSFNCAMAYIKDYHRDNNSYTKNLLELYYKFHGTRIYFIKESPSRHIMEKYGGNMTDSQYISFIHNLEKTTGVEISTIRRQYISQELPPISEEIGLTAWEMC